MTYSHAEEMDNHINLVDDRYEWTNDEIEGMRAKIRQKSKESNARVLRREATLRIEEGADSKVQTSSCSDSDVGSWKIQV